ncbi:MAG: RagB/SusD family nutrient uptake outer membrane protein [Bacteroidales bacterium]|nr:RagB/SusD family nutrient uptake outer membrane protein [Bacteroidales bacterium]
MKNRIILYMSLLLLGVFSHSCTSEFLELNPIAAENEAAFYKTMAHADQAIIACYSQFNNTGVWCKDLLMGFGDIASDDAEAGGDFVNEVPDMENLNRLVLEKTDGKLSDTYGTLYRHINFANIAIDRLPSIAETDPDVDMDLLNKRIGEAKFIRAIAHFYLTIVFGEVPLVDHILGPSEYTMGRAKLKDIYNLIEQDCKDAMAVLPERGGWNGEEGRATKGAAQALLARMCLYESSYAKYYKGQDSRFDGCTERWADVVNYCEQVMNSGKYKLVGIDGEKYETWRSPQTNGYRYIFTSQGDHSPETVFEITCLQEGLGNAGARGHSLAKWSTSRYYFDENGKESSTNYWGLGLPNPELIQLFGDGDIRRETTMSFEGDTSWIEIAGGKRYTPSFSHSVTKTYQKKWECSAEEYIDHSAEWMHAPSNIKLIRYSDVYLMAAEAALMLGDNPKALAYVNKVRERARMCGTSGLPAALTSVSLNDIILERRLEFAGEGHRMFDIVRWNIAADVIKQTYDGTPIEYVRGKHEFQPLPQREVDLSEGKLVQYPGW